MGPIYMIQDCTVIHVLAPSHALVFGGRRIAVPICRTVGMGPGHTSTFIGVGFRCAMGPIQSITSLISLQVRDSNQVHVWCTFENFCSFLIYLIFMKEEEVFRMRI